MIEIKRTSKFSEILSASIYEYCLTKKKERYEGSKIIQVVANDEGTFVYLEIVLAKDIDNYIAEQTPNFQSSSVANNGVEPLKTKKDKDLETALETVFENDPKGKYTGKKLREMFDKKDSESINWYLENLLNKFIRSRIELIAQSGYGGCEC